jgi:hypothetical protein
MTIGTTIDGFLARTSHAWNRPSWWNLLVVLPWAIGLVLMINEWRTDGQIAARQRTTSGVITAHDPANHNQYGYKFEVEGKSYTGWEGPKDRELAIGETVLCITTPRNQTRTHSQTSASWAQRV